MKKILLTLAAVAALTAACNLSIENNDDTEPVQEAVDFGAYINRGVTTKAGAPGTLTTDLDGTVKLTEVGFGVFAYHTSDALYNESCRPDFMYNQKVTYNGSAWVYDPVKYWPNEFGVNAASDDIDRLTFFAYAPYTDVSASSGIVSGDASTGIVALSRNSSTGDPFVKYVTSMDPATRVDLCWGVSKSGLTSSVDGSNNHIAAGTPYVDVLKPKTGDKIDFDFRHALAALNVQIDAAVDATTPGTEVDANTRIFVRSISFEGVATRGTLNMNSSVTDGPVWNDLIGVGKLSPDPVTVYDGRRDGKEGAEGSVAKNEVPAALNPVLVQNVPYTSTALPSGVTKTPVNVFNSTTADAAIFVIPTAEPLKVTIVYDVETKDDKLAVYLSDGVTHGSTVENIITKSIQMSGNDLVLEAGKQYTINLHLGMTTVKFDASVNAWGTGSGAGTADLPQNTAN